MTLTSSSASLPNYSALSEAYQQASLRLLRAQQQTTSVPRWRDLARPNQLPPDGDWRIWLILAGRGFGKTRSIVEFASEQAEQMPGSRGAIVGPTAADVRDVLIEGESGILATARPDFRPRYEPSKRRLTWPNGTIATTYSADEPDRLRGPQHHWGIADELAAWRYPATLDMLLMGLRLGDNPRLAIATTPRPIPLIKRLLSDPTVVVATGTTYDNAANLAQPFLDAIVRRYEGTRLGRQELEGVVLDDNPAALWNRDIIQYKAIA